MAREVSLCFPRLHFGLVRQSECHWASARSLLTCVFSDAKRRQSDRHIETRLFCRRFAAHAARLDRVPWADTQGYSLPSLRDFGVLLGRWMFARGQFNETLATSVRARPSRFTYFDTSWYCLNAEVFSTPGGVTIARSG